MTFFGNGRTILGAVSLVTFALLAVAPVEAHAAATYPLPPITFGTSPLRFARRTHAPAFCARDVLLAGRDVSFRTDAWSPVSTAVRIFPKTSGTGSVGVNLMLYGALFTVAGFITGIAGALSIRSGATGAYVAASVGAVLAVGGIVMLVFGVRRHYGASISLAPRRSSPWFLASSY